MSNVRPPSNPLKYPVQTVSPSRPGFIKQAILQNRNLSRSVEQKQPQRAVEMNSMNKMNSVQMKPINVAPIGNSLGSGNGVDLSGEIKNSKAAQIMKNQKQKK